jgi:predicted  nucleic acid-binding Zn-ribbon protein
MSDIVKQLRYGTQQRSFPALIELCSEAADEIERLRRCYEHLKNSMLELATQVRQFTEQLDAREDEIERLQASLKMTNGSERQLSAYLKLEAEVERLRAAAKAFDACLSTDCDGPERDALRAALDPHS